MDEQNTNNMQPKPGDIVKPNLKPVQPLVDVAPAPAAAPAVTEVVAPTPTPPVKPKPVPMPTPEVASPVVPPPVEPTPTITPVPSHRTGPIFAAVLLVVLLIVGALLYFLYFRNMGAPAPAPVETRETSESTMTDRTTQQDTTSLQYLESVFGNLDSSTTELTNDMETESQLNLGTSTNNSSEL